MSTVYHDIDYEIPLTDNVGESAAEPCIYDACTSTCYTLLSVVDVCILVSMISALLDR
jgi:hypothetical protein